MPPNDSVAIAAATIDVDWDDDCGNDDDDGCDYDDDVTAIVDRNPHWMIDSRP